MREALTNIVRHADASKAGVTVTRRSDRVTVEITDDGRGGDFAEGLRDSWDAGTGRPLWAAHSGPAHRPPADSQSRRTYRFPLKDIEPDDLRSAVRVVAAGEALLAPSR